MFCSAIRSRDFGGAEPIVPRSVRSALTWKLAIPDSPNDIGRIVWRQPSSRVRCTARLRCKGPSEQKVDRLHNGYANRLEVARTGQRRHLSASECLADQYLRQQPSLDQ
jgi:hypothetical protein